MEERTIGLSVTSDAVAGELAVYGMATSRSGHEPLEFQQISVGYPYSAVFVGIPNGPVSQLGGLPFKLELAVTNFSNSVRSAQVMVSRADHDELLPIAQLTLLPLQSQRFSLPELAESGNLKASLIVDTDDMDGQVIASVRALSDSLPVQVMEIPTKVGNKPYNGGQHPWSLTDGDHADLVLFNNTNATQPIDLQLYAPSTSISSHVTLKPFQTQVFSVASLLKAGETDSSGHPTAKNPENGIVNWFSLGTDAVFGRLLISNAATMSDVSFSCYTKTITCGSQIGSIIAANPVGTTSVGSNSTLTGYALTCPGTPGNCECNGSGACTSTTGTPTSSYWSSQSPSIATIVGSTQNQQTATISGVSGGSATLLYIGNNGVCNGRQVTGTFAVTTCPIPSAESVVFYQWGDNDPLAGYNASVAGFIQTLTPSAVYTNGTVSESNASPATDSCWFSGSPYLSVSGVTGSSWTVGSNGNWQPDYVGYVYKSFDYYQKTRPKLGLSLPCGFTMFQQLTFKCPNNGSSEVYDSPVILQSYVSGGGISVTREGVTVTRNLIGN